MSEVVRLRTWVYSGCPSLPAIGQQVPLGSVREVDPLGATVVLFTMRLHIRFDAWEGRASRVGPRKSLDPARFRN